jgi:uncharacterized membrane protein YfcA
VAGGALVEVEGLVHIYPADLVPPTVVTPDPAIVAAAGLVLVAGGLLGGWLARRTATRADVRQQLRQLS